MLGTIGIVFGTRPEYLKCKPLFNAFEKANLDYKIIQVKQHKDLEIEEKEKKQYVCIDLESTQGLSRLNELASELPKSIESIIKDCTHILIQGDTATAFFGCLTAFHLHKKIIHLEAGLRTYDLENPFPEEAYRSMISRLATYHFCPDEQAKDNLLRENIQNNIFIVGNTILDLLKSYNFNPTLSNKILITIHRRENWDTLLEIASTISELALEYPHFQFEWILHPNPNIAKQIQDFFEKKNINNIILYKPLSHKELSQKIYEAYCIFTDSGGIQEEASFVGKVLFVFRKVTERNAIPTKYIHMIEEHKKLYSVFKNTTITLLEPCTVYGNGNSSNEIVNILRSIPEKFI